MPAAALKGRARGRYDGQGRRPIGSPRGGTLSFSGKGRTQLGEDLLRALQTRWLFSCQIGEIYPKHSEFHPRKALQHSLDLVESRVVTQSQTVNPFFPHEKGNRGSGALGS